jgi:tRNA (cytidine56-2'-O)-methyltransferase
MRLGHRPERDKRITTHVGLVARAFGADEMFLTGRDRSVEESLADVAKRWGGNFRIRADVRWRQEALNWRDAGGKIVHLTMYGTNIPDVINDIKNCDKIMVVVGAEKVPAEMYDLADWNVAVGSQPHSEVAALALFLDRLFEGRELRKDFEGGLKILPSARGKQVIGYPEDAPKRNEMQP